MSSSKQSTPAPTAQRTLRGKISRRKRAMKKDLRLAVISAIVLISLGLNGAFPRTAFADEVPPPPPEASEPAPVEEPAEDPTEPPPAEEPTEPPATEPAATEPAATEPRQLSPRPRSCPRSDHRGERSVRDRLGVAGRDRVGDPGRQRGPARTEHDRGGRDHGHGRSDVVPSRQRAGRCGLHGQLHRIR